jgi:hypothetical protein
MKDPSEAPSGCGCPPILCSSARQDGSLHKDFIYQHLDTRGAIGHSSFIPLSIPPSVMAEPQAVPFTKQEIIDAISNITLARYLSGKSFPYTLGTINVITIQVSPSP